jgi:hypothetical protein
VAGGEEELIGGEGDGEDEDGGVLSGSCDTVQGGRRSWSPLLQSLL